MREEVNVYVKRASEAVQKQVEATVGYVESTTKVPKDDVMSIALSKELPRMILNPDKEKALKIIDRIYKCGGHCPCQPNTGDDTFCPCSDFISEHKCHCKLFVEA